MGGNFQEQVLALGKIGGQARAMMVTDWVERAIQYDHAIRDYLIERKSLYKAIVAFSGEHEYFVVGSIPIRPTRSLERGYKSHSRVVTPFLR